MKTRAAIIKLTTDAGFNTDLVYGTPRVVCEVSADVERVNSSRYETVDEQSSLVGCHDLRRRLGKDELGINTGVRLVLFHAVVFDLHVRSEEW